MIRPSPKLLLWFCLIALPFVGVAGALPSFAGVAALICAVALIVAVLDVIAAFALLRNVRMELPESVRMTRGREGGISVVLHHGAGCRIRVLRVGLPLPYSFCSECETLPVRLAEDAEASRMVWETTPDTRGLFSLSEGVVGLDSPAGLWEVGLRCRTERPCEVHVYPNLLVERRNLAALFLNHGSLGLHSQRQVGQGREFEKLREYLPGDSFEDIHWKATAKRGRPITKEYQVERTQEVYVIIDASRMSARQIDMASATGEETETNVLEYYLRAALLLGLVAERQGDLFGLATFSDTVHRFVRAKGGKGHFDTCRDTLYQLQARQVTPDFEELCAFLKTRLRRRALLIFLTSLDDPLLAESFARNMELFRGHHLVVAAMFRPAGAVPILTGPPADSVDDVYNAVGGHLRWNDLKELNAVLHRRGVQFDLLDGESACSQLISRYMNIKQRQLL